MGEEISHIKLKIKKDKLQKEITKTYEELKGYYVNRIN